MDLYEHGIITKADLRGIDLKWGDRDATVYLADKPAIHRYGHHINPGGHHNLLQHAAPG